MSDSAQAPDSSNGSPPNKDSPPAWNESPPSETPPSPTDGSMPPDSGQNPSPPDQSSLSPPELNPSPPTSSPSPPSDSNSPPPAPPSDSTTPVPSAPSNSSPPKSSPPSDSNTTSPSPGGSSSKPPTDSPPAVPDPPFGSPPTSSPATPGASPSPPAPESAGSSPPARTNAPPLPESPPAVIPPQVPGSPDAPQIHNPTPSSEATPSLPSLPSSPTSPSSQGSDNSAGLTPPSTDFGSDSSSRAQSSPSPKSSGSSAGGSVAGVAVAGVLIIALVAIFFVISRKRKRKAKAFYMPTAADNFSVQTGEYHYGQQHTMAVPGHSNESYNTGKPPPIGTGNTYGSSGGGHGYSSSGPDSGVFSTKSSFGYEELMKITNGFSRENILGEGGFGCVYKGWLPDGRVVAVKQLKAGSGQGEREFRAEVEIISRVHHRHLVSLVGYCIAEYHRLLVYEFVPNNTLEHHLHGTGLPVLEWSKRVKIAVGAARGLAYLHEDCHPKIIHRDIKSANILLDDAFEAQVADFGLAKLSNDTFSHVSTRVMGTFGYMAPEYASSGKLTDRSDVFSFGVMLLEMVTGRKPVDASQPLGDESLVEWARPLLIKALETGDVSELVDSRLEKRYIESEMLRMIEAAAACVRHSAPKRPRMVQVMRALDTEGDMPDLTNGVKVGQSAIFGSANSELQRFQRMAFGSEDSSEYDLYSGEFREVPLRSSTSRRPGESGSVKLPSGELEVRPMNPRGGGSRWF